MRTKHPFRILMVLLPLALVLAACNTSGDAATTTAASDTTTSIAGDPTTTASDTNTTMTSPSEIALGATAALTGPFAGSCTVQSAAVEAWIEHINESGGVDGAQITWTVLDDGGDPERGASNVRRLIESDGVVALLSSCGTPGVVASLPLAEEAGVPMLFPNSVSSSVQLPPPPNVFSIIPLFDQQAAALFNHLVDTQGPGDVALVYLDGFDPNIVPAMEQLTTDAGVELVEAIPVAVDEANWGSIVIRLQEAEPDYVIMAGTTPGAAQLAVEMDRQGFEPTAYASTYGAADSIFLQSAGPAGEGVITASPVVAPSDPAAEECNATLPEDVDPSFYTVLGCATVQAGLEVIARALEMGGATPENMIEAVTTLDGFETGLLPPLSFSDTHLLGDGIAIWQVSDEQYETLGDFAPLPEPTWR